MGGKKREVGASSGSKKKKSPGAKGNHPNQPPKPGPSSKNDASERGNMERAGPSLLPSANYPVFPDTLATAASTSSSPWFLPGGFQQQVHYASNEDQVKSLKAKYSILSGEDGASNACGAVVGVSCAGSNNCPRLLCVCTPNNCFVFDLKYVPNVLHHLGDFFRSHAVLKTIHDLYSSPLLAALNMSEHDSLPELGGFVDLQLVAESIHGMGMSPSFDDTLKALMPESTRKAAHVCILLTEWWKVEHLTRATVEAAASVSALLQCSKHALLGALGSNGSLEELINSSHRRWRYAVSKYSVERHFYFDETGFKKMSRELVPENVLNSQPSLSVEAETENLLNLLPEDLRSQFRVEETGEWVLKVAEKTYPLSGLSDIVLDYGRFPQVWFGGAKRVLLGDGGRKVTKLDILNVTGNMAGSFGSDNRAGLEGKLHRISALKSREDEVLGLTLRVGRCVWGNAKMIQDILLGAGKSILILGSPGSGSCVGWILPTERHLIGQRKHPNNFRHVQLYSFGNFGFLKQAKQPLCVKFRGFLLNVTTCALLIHLTKLRVMEVNHTTALVSQGVQWYVHAAAHVGRESQAQLLPGPILPSWNSPAALLQLLEAHGSHGFD